MTSTPPVSTPLISAHAAGLATLGRTHPLDTPVPTCGGWNLADLVWHLAEVHRFWGHIISRRPAGPDTYEPPTRPADAELPDLLDAAARELVGLLDAADPADPAWSWSSDETVGFTVRRQVHEAIIHHVDGIVAVGGPLPHVAPEVADDGVDELVTVMLAGVPEWATYHPGEATIRLASTDMGTAHDLEFGHMTGISPDSGRTYDIEAMRILDALPSPTTTVSGPALALDLWMWGRGSAGALTIAGDTAGADRLRTLVGETTR